MTVTAVNDVPVAADDTVTMAQGTSAAIVVLANDVDADGDSLTVTALGTPEHGTVVVNSNGVVSYTPDAALQRFGLLQLHDQRRPRRQRNRDRHT